MKSLLIAVVAFLLLASCDGSNNPQSSEFSYSIDDQLTDLQIITTDSGRVEAVQDSEGTTSRFIGNEVIIQPSTEQQLTDFLERYDALVIGSDEVPEPPQELGLTLSDQDKAAASYRVLVNASDFPLDNLARDAEALGLDQPVSMSSGEAARLLALVLHEYRNGLAIAPNFLMDLHDWLEETREHPETAESFFNPFDQPWYNETGAKTNVTLMWQAVHAIPPLKRTRVAILDIGFWLDDAGRPFASLDGGTSDFPSNPLQYNFDQGTPYAGGVYAGGAERGALWHGNDVAGIATAYHNNEYGIAGTGGQVADPMMFRIGIGTFMNWYEVGSAVRTAVSWNADVINMSFGGPCDNMFCDLFLEDSLYSSLRNARDNGVIVVVSSGNDTLRNTGHIISADGMVPCKADETICVGATVPDSNGVSNYANAGSRVDIWAPACIPTTPNGASPESLPVVCGTSFSSPFVAGIVAVMKAYEPDLGLEDVRNILRSTAWTDSPDAEVTHSINAYAALRAVAEEKGADPFVKISGSALDGGSNEVPLNRTFTLTAQVYESIFAYMNGEPSCPPAICPVTWSPTPESITSGAQFKYTSPGEQTIIAASTNSAGNVRASAVIVNVINQPTIPIIVEPLANSSVFQGIPVSFKGHGMDPNAGPGPGPGMINSECEWWILGVDSSFEHQLLNCDVTFTFPVTGEFRIDLIVTDAQGVASHTLSQNLTVVAAPAVPGPNSGLALPSPNYADIYYDRYVPISVTMTASGNTNTPYSYLLTATSYWSTASSAVYATRELDTINTSNTTVNRSYNLNNVGGLLRAPGDHNCFTDGQWVRLTLTVTDKDGNTGTGSSQLIQVLCPLL